MSDVPAFMMKPLPNDLYHGNILTMPSMQPRLVVVRQPKKRGYRFRYSSEGQTHGGIPGEADKEDSKRKVFPTIKLMNHNGPARVVVTLATSDETMQLHPHTLIVDKQKTKGFHIFYLKTGESSLELRNIAIQHVVKENLIETLMKRILSTNYIRNFGWNSGFNIIKEEIDLSHYTDALEDDGNKNFVDKTTARAVAGLELEHLKKEAKKLSKDMKMNEVRLCFQAFLQDERGKYTVYTEPVYSDIIYDGKTKHGAMLKIIRINKAACPVTGDEEVWILADKVNADDIEVCFSEHEENIYPAIGAGKPWEAVGTFAKTDVYKQCLMVVKTPPYHDQDIRQPKNVSLRLRRKHDHSCVSDAIDFKYTPINRDRHGIGEKRKKEIPVYDDFDLLASQPSNKRLYSNGSPPPIDELSSQEILRRSGNVETFELPGNQFIPSLPELGNFDSYLLKQEDNTTNGEEHSVNDIFAQLLSETLSQPPLMDSTAPSSSDMSFSNVIPSDVNSDYNQHILNAIVNSLTKSLGNADVEVQNSLQNSEDMNGQT